MRKYYSLVLLLVTTSVFSQIGIGTSNPDPSAVLDINSEISPGVKGGLKLPTVANDTERGQIDLSGNPVGLIIYNQASRCIEMYDIDTTSWVDIQCLPALPQTSVEFASTATTIIEDNTETISINIINPSVVNDTTVEINLQSGSTLGTLGNDFDIEYNGSNIISFPFTITFPANSSSSQDIIIYHYDDADTVDETGILELQNPSGGVTTIVGTNAINTLTFDDDDAPVGCSGSSQLITWDFDGNSGSEATVAATVVDANIDSGLVSRGSGLTNPGNANRFNASSFTTTSFNANDYFEFNIVVSSGQFADLKEINFNFQRSGTGPRNMTLRSSLDGFVSNLDTFSIPDSTGVQSLSSTLSGHDGQQNTITFRLYVHDAEGGSGTGGFEGTDVDLEILGCTY